MLKFLHISPSVLFLCQFCINLLKENFGVAKSGQEPPLYLGLGPDQLFSPWKNTNEKQSGFSSTRTMSVNHALFSQQIKAENIPA